MTAFERSKIKESDKERAAREAKEREMAAKRQVSEEDYAKQMRLEEENRNRFVVTALFGGSEAACPPLILRFLS
jgi:hypothetical protein